MIKNRNYKVLHNVNGYCLIGDLSSDKYQFYYKYKKDDKNIKVKKLKSIIVITSVLFFISIVFFSKIFLMPISNDVLYDNYYIPYNTLITTRSSENKQDSIKMMYDYILNKEYDKSINIISKEKNIVLQHFYLGVLFQDKGDYKKAIEEYQFVIRNNNNLFVEISMWYSGLCYLKIKDDKNAYYNFKKLSEGNNDNYYHISSQKILKNIYK